MTSPTYNYRIEKENTNDEIQYLFISKGERDIVKAVQYNYVGDLDGKRIFNLAFGDYNLETDELDDEANTANGDVFCVFNTVLNTISSFFETFPKGIIVVAGSDSKPEFIEKCRKSCKKKCNEVCKNADRRIGIYRGYVDKNFDELSENFGFYGGYTDPKNNKKTILEEYTRNKKYTSVFVYKK